MREDAIQTMDSMEETCCATITEDLSEVHKDQAEEEQKEEPAKKLEAKQQSAPKAEEPDFSKIQTMTIDGKIITPSSMARFFVSASCAPSFFAEHLEKQ